MARPIPTLLAVWAWLTNSSNSSSVYCGCTLISFFSYFCSIYLFVSASTKSQGFRNRTKSLSGSLISYEMAPTSLKQICIAIKVFWMSTNLYDKMVLSDSARSPSMIFTKIASSISTSFPSLLVKFRVFYSILGQILIDGLYICFEKLILSYPVAENSILLTFSGSGFFLGSCSCSFFSTFISIFLSSNLNSWAGAVYVSTLSV